ncbi:MAG: HD domain-containing phosphohydrolase [Halanaerobiales bacterium]
MKSPDKVNSSKKLKSINILYDKLNNIIKKNQMDSFGLILFSFNLTKFDLNYSERIKLFKSIVSYLDKYIDKEDEFYQLEKDQLIIFTKNENLEVYSKKLNDRLKKKNFLIDNETLDLSIDKSDARWPHNGSNFEELLDFLINNTNSSERKNNNVKLPTYPDNILINKKEEYIDKVEKDSTQLYLLAKNDNLEIIRQKIVSEKTFQIIGGEKDNFELFYILEGKIYNEKEDILLTPGDSITVGSGKEEKYFKTLKETTLLYITSTPIFASKQKRINELLSLNRKVAETDVETNEHCNRLQQLSRITAKELGLKEKKLFYLGYASFLHDIGKAEVPASLLQKPGSLNKEEWEIMKKHAEWGKEIILKNFTTKNLTKVAEIIYQHHEKWDGSGYPQGLKGDEILIEAQILSVVDAYDAMTYERPYQKALSREEAIEEIKSEKGKQFSPRAVEAFLKAEKKFINEQQQS